MKESNLSRLKDRGVGGFLLKHIVFEQMDHINYLLFRPDWCKQSFIALLVLLLLLLLLQLHRNIAKSHQLYVPIF